MAARIMVVPHFGHGAVVADESGVAVGDVVVAWIMVLNQQAALGVLKTGARVARAGQSLNLASRIFKTGQ